MTVHSRCLPRWSHDHTFGQDEVRPGERRTLWVIGITTTTMLVEVAAGLYFGSMALLADGLHMASHTAALGLAAFAYWYARRHARDQRFAFGTGKVNSLAAFAGAVLLGAFAAVMAWESVERILDPVPISFDGAIAVAVLGLAVNALSAWILVGGSARATAFSHPRGADPHAHDHNLRSAYLHVVADMLTSVLAITALGAGKYLGLTVVDPAVGILGAVIILRWSHALTRQTAAVLLDRQAPREVQDRIREALEAESGDTVADIHIWSIAPASYAAILSVVTSDPRSADDYKARLPADLDLDLAHVSVEVHRCAHDESPAAQQT